MKTISCEPDWQGMFSFAVNIVKTNIPQDQGRETVIEMLEFGKRLQAFHDKVKAETKKTKTQTEKF